MCSELGGKVLPQDPIVKRWTVHTETESRWSWRIEGLEELLVRGMLGLAFGDFPANTGLGLEWGCALEPRLQGLAPAQATRFWGKAYLDSFSVERGC